MLVRQLFNVSTLYSSYYHHHNMLLTTVCSFSVGWDSTNYHGMVIGEKFMDFPIMHRFKWDHKLVILWSHRSWWVTCVAVSLLWVCIILWYLYYCLDKESPAITCVKLTVTIRMQYISCPTAWLGSWLRCPMYLYSSSLIKVVKLYLDSWILAVNHVFGHWPTVAWLS